MTERIRLMLKELKRQDYRKLRTDGITVSEDDMSTLTRRAETFRKLAEAEKPVIFENDLFGFNRYTKTCFNYPWGNITPNWGRIITNGFEKTVSDINTAISLQTDKEKAEYGKIMLNMLESALIIAKNYREAAKGKNEKLYAVLCKIPLQGAENYYEALVFLKFCIFFLRLSGLPHLTLGGFDKYMYPFYLKSRDAGFSEEELLEMTEAFFISINYDTDLYFGIQKGDNGQSMVLGGFDRNGNDMFNELSKSCLDASLELALIDPKINLRVGKKTPIERYEYATLLTKKGLGFPQYCNDDVAIPGLIKLGYSPEDAYNYTVAACWEYIVPNNAMDIPNLATMSFPNVTAKAIKENILSCNSFDILMKCVTAAIADQCDSFINKYSQMHIHEAPLLSVFVDGCIEKLTDATRHGGKYLNFGCHGAGISTAADSLAAIKKLVYDDKAISRERLLEALASNFEGYADIRNELKSCPKMGNNNDYVDDIAALLMDAFAQNINNRPNGFGGIWRAGTGSAMEYILSAKECPATADGRVAGEPFSSSFSPSLDVKPDGLLSVISSFTKYDMTNIINGGPLTIEIHDTVLRNDIGINKVAALVKLFIELGGHQLQVNSVNRDILLDAQCHPEKYPNLVVRVWGWSGYFNELDLEYQNHIIRRCEFISV